MMNNGYIESDARVNVEAVADGMDIKPWISKYNQNDVRYYLNIDDLQNLCLKQTCYKSGNVNCVQYVNADGETVTVAHGRFYNIYFNKTYIDHAGCVHTNWRPYGTVGENFAEAVAVSLGKKFGFKK